MSFNFEVFDNIHPNTTWTTLGNGVTVTGATIVNPGDSQTYTFPGTAGQRIYYDGLASASTDLDAELTDPFGNILFNTVASSRDQGPYTLTYSGTYTLTIDSSPGSISPEATGLTASRCMTRRRRRPSP